MSNVYVVYKGDDVVAVGGVDEVAERLGIKRSHVEWLATPTAHRRAERSPRRMVAERVRAADTA